VLSTFGTPVETWDAMEPIANVMRYMQIFCRNTTLRA
jgi:hypothetical protein